MMSLTIDKTAALEALAVQTLTADELVGLAHRLLDAAGPPTDEFPLTDAMKAELDRRIAAADADPNRGTPWEIVRDRVAAKYLKPGGSGS